MAKRVIDTNLWEDEKWCDSITSPKGRLLWLYLLTCPSSKSVGIFQLNLRKVAFDTGLDIDEVKQYLMLFTDLKMCIYDRETTEIVIWNYPIYNICSWGKPMQDKVKSELSTVKNTSSIELMTKALKSFIVTHPQDKRAELMSKVVEIYEEALIPVKEKKTIKENKGLSNNKDTNNNIYIHNYNDTGDVSCQEEENSGKSWEEIIGDLKDEDNEDEH